MKIHSMMGCRTAVTNVFQFKETPQRSDGPNSCSSTNQKLATGRAGLSPPSQCPVASSRQSWDRDLCVWNSNPKLIRWSMTPLRREKVLLGREKKISTIPLKCKVCKIELKVYNSEKPSIYKHIPRSHQRTEKHGLPLLLVSCKRTKYWALFLNTEFPL